MVGLSPAEGRIGVIYAYVRGVRRDHARVGSFQCFT